MSDLPPALLPDPTLARERDLDALAGLLPFDARERLAVLLTDEDAATLNSTGGFCRSVRAGAAAAVPTDTRAAVPDTAEGL